MHITIIVKKNNLLKRGKKKRKKKKQQKNTTAHIVTNVRARGFNAGLLGEVSLLSLAPEQMLNWYPNSTLHCMLLMQPSLW
jgi:hypothetical protein